MRGQHGFQSTLPARGSDIMAKSMIRAKIQFQSTLPARGSDSGATTNPNLETIFQSTLPARGSDLKARFGRYVRADFNPRSPQGGATQRARFKGRATRISIHAPRKGERQTPQGWRQPQGGFQSTLPARGSDAHAIFSVPIH